jgi:hypothetical protein
MIRKFTHITIILILLISTVGFTINFHYCNDKIYDVGIYSEATSCCSVDVHEHHNKKNHHHSCDSESHKNDCEDETLKFESLDSFIGSFNNFNANNESYIDLFIVSAVITDILHFENTVSEEIIDYNVLPPKTPIVLALHQSYLL